MAINYLEKLSAKYADFKKNLVNQKIVYNPDAQIANMVGKILKEHPQVTSALNVELINLFVHQHQPEIAFKCISLMECQQSVGSQNINNDQQ